jgi:hypothetical protein
MVLEPRQTQSYTNENLASVAVRLQRAGALETVLPSFAAFFSRLRLPFPPKIGAVAQNAATPSVKYVENIVRFVRDVALTRMLLPLLVTLRPLSNSPPA